jgi:hypothetical protein
VAVVAVDQVLGILMLEQAKMKPLCWLDQRPDFVGESGIGRLEDQAASRDVAVKLRRKHGCQSWSHERLELRKFDRSSDSAILGPNVWEAAISSLSVAWS